ncbi:polysaccharide biosynthesis tyrosine autokinase [Roseicyclus amphidinii]|uniref:polysaccharide biosynthesis tyrosine autokinase n=1 Tax=Roseicyclus amphidinii TaxID=3034232 RepID=UPI0024E168EA|nr:polysaccharide biosynthesis tyrosine autokinase [Roseicyclus sp. Amp-Y-6]
MVDLRNTPLPSSAVGDDSEIDLKDILAQLMARKVILAIAVIVGATVGAFIGQLPSNEFRASAVVQIEQRADRIPLPSELIGELLTGGTSTNSGLDTEVHIIRSRLVLGPVVDRLNARTRVEPAAAPVIGGIMQRRTLPVVGPLVGSEYARANESITAALSDLGAGHAEERFLVHVTGPATYTLTLASGLTLEGRLGEPLALPEGGALRVTAINAPAGREYTVYQEPVRNSVGRISSGLIIRERGNSGVVDFSYIGENGREATAIVNAVIDEYIDQNLRRRSVEIDRSIDFIEQQLATISGELRQANADLNTYRQTRQFDELSVGTQELLEAAVAVEARLEELAFEREQLLQVLTVNHPDIERLDVEATRLQERLAELRVDLESVPAVEQELAVLVQRVERSQTLEQQLRERVEQLRILRASAVGNIRVLEPAETAVWIGPDRRRPIYIGSALALVFAIAGVLGLNMLRRGVEDARDIEGLGLPLFATVNKASELVSLKSDQPEYGLAKHDPGNVTVEALRGLRTGLKFALAAASSKSLMITSCAPSDGKSFISLNLAIVAGQTGARVLLIDADMRRGFLRRYFKFSKNHPGLSDALAGTRENCVTHVPDLSIDFMPTGRFPPNPSELLEGQAFLDLLNAANEEYDLVIVDAPPALAVADPAIIGQHVGLSMLVVRHLHTTVADIQSAQKVLATAGVRLSGAILNQFDERRTRYGQYGGRYGQYYGGYRYSYETSDDKS